MALSGIQRLRQRKLSLDEVRVHIQNRRSELEDTWTRTLSETFEAKLKLLPNLNVTHCVCLGVGNFRSRFGGVSA